MSDHGKIHLLELSAISLEGVEKTMDAFGRVVHALHVAAHYIPPFALLLDPTINTSSVTLISVPAPLMKCK